VQNLTINNELSYDNTTAAVLASQAEGHRRLNRGQATKTRN